MSIDPRSTSVLRGLAVVALILLLGACTSEEPARDLDLDQAESADSQDESGDDSPSPSPDAAGVPEPSAPPREGDTVRQQEAAVYALGLPTQQPATLVGQTLVDYMTVRVEGYNTGVLDLPALSALAIGDPLQTVQTRILELDQAGQRTVGDIWIEMADEDVAVKRDNARFEDVCVSNASVDVDQKNVAVESPPSHYLASGRATRFAKDVWLIDTLSFESVNEC